MTSCRYIYKEQSISPVPQEGLLLRGGLCRSPLRRHLSQGDLEVLPQHWECARVAQKALLQQSHFGRCDMFGNKD